MRHLILACATLAAHALDQPIYVGTSTRSGAAQGIYALRLGEGGGAAGIALAAGIADPLWLTRSPDRRVLYAIARDALVAYMPDADGALVERSRQPLTGAVPCAGEPDPSGRMLVVATYTGGTIEVFPLAGDGSIGPRTLLLAPTHASRVDAGRQEKSHPHGVTWAPDGRHVLVPDLGADRVYVYRADPATAGLAPHAPRPWFDLAPGSGPRHAVFSPDGRHLYVIGELDCSLTVCRWDAATATAEPLARALLRTPGAAGAASGAEVLVHPDGTRVYATLRGDDLICTLPRDASTGLLGAVERTPCGGRTPRHAVLAAGGALLLCGHQDDASIAVFSTAGTLTRMALIPGIPQPVCVLP